MSQIDLSKFEQGDDNVKSIVNEVYANVKRKIEIELKRRDEELSKTFGHKHAEQRDYIARENDRVDAAFGRFMDRGVENGQDTMGTGTNGRGKDV